MKTALSLLFLIGNLLFAQTSAPQTGNAVAAITSARTYYVCAKANGGTCVYDGDGGTTAATIADTNACLTKAAPCRTIQGALNKFRGSVLQAAVTLQLADTAGSGTDLYRPNLTIVDNPVTSLGAPTSFFAASVGQTETYPTGYVYIHGNTTTPGNVSVCGSAGCATTSADLTGIVFQGTVGRVSGVAFKYFGGSGVGADFGPLEAHNSVLYVEGPLTAVSDNKATTVVCWYHSTCKIGTATGKTITITDTNFVDALGGSMVDFHTPASAAALTTVTMSAGASQPGAMLIGNSFAKIFLDNYAFTFTGTGAYIGFSAYESGNIYYNDQFGNTFGSPSTITFTNATGMTVADANQYGSVYLLCSGGQASCSQTGNVGKLVNVANGALVSLQGTLPTATSANTSRSGGRVISGNFPAEVMQETLRSVVYEGSTSGTVTVDAPAVAGTTTFRLPGANGTTGQFLQTDGSGVTSWGTASGSGTVNSGTSGRMAYYASTGTAISGNANATISSGALTLGVAGTTIGNLLLAGNTSGAVTVAPQAAAGTYNFNLPTGAGTSGQPLLSGGGGATAMTFGTLGVAAGGSGATTLTGVLKGNGASAFTAVTAPSGAIVGDTDTQTLTNKTLTNPSLGADSVPSAVTQSYTNDGTTGTANKLIAKLSANDTAVKVGTSDTEALGIVLSGGATTGSALIAISGTVTCTFDNTATAGHYVQISTGTAGDCHDAGATLPTSGGTILGRVASGGVAGDRQVALAITPVTTLATVATSGSASDLSAGTLAVARGGTGTGSTLTGLVRGNSSAMTAAELSGDATTSGSNAVSVVKVNGASVPASSKVSGTNSSSQLVAATATDTEGILFCTDAGVSDAYACNLSPAISGYTTGVHYRFKGATANTGAATLALNSLAATTIKKAAGGITTDLADNDIRAGQWVDVVYDGTNFQMQSVLGNTASGTGDFSSNTSTSVDSEFVLFSSTAGKTGKRATGTGIARSASGVYSAAELSGDATTSGSNAVTVVKVNGASVPASAKVAGTNSSSQVVAATANDTEAIVSCADAAANDTYACDLSPAITAYTTGNHYRFKANTVNTGAATINLNSLGAKTIKKVVGGITTDLADNDIRAGQWVSVVYDGTNMQMQSMLGNTFGDPAANGVVVRTSVNTTTARTITAGTGIAMTNGDGQSGNPTVALGTTTKRATLLNWSTTPDTSGNVFTEPYPIKATNDFWKYSIWVFNDTATKDCLHGQIEVPSDYNTGGTTKVYPIWSSTATTNNVVWNFDYRIVGGDDTTSLDQATAQETPTAVTDAAPGAANRRLTTTAFTLTAANPTANSTMQWRLCRDGTSGSDTMAAAAQLHNLVFEYGVN